MAVPGMTVDSAEEMAVDPVPIKLTITGEEEDELALKREKDNDEKQLRKISRKLHQYANARREAAARASLPTITPEIMEDDRKTIEEACDNVQIELGAFLTLMEKLELTRLAEERQATEYDLIQVRISAECDATRDEIARLKVELQDAEETRERKKQYDVIADRINTLPPRSELNGSIAELESEIATIHAEQETTHEIIATKKTMMEDILSRIREMILHGKESQAMLEIENEDISTPRSVSPTEQRDDIPSIHIEGSSDSRRSTPLPSSHLNPSAAPFRPSASPLSSPAGLPLLHPHAPSRTHSSNLLSHNTRPEISSPLAVGDSPSPGAVDEGPEDGEDIEMGEVSPSTPAHAYATGINGNSRNGHLSAPGSGSRKRQHTSKEDLEEGEASDSSSDLSSVPGGD